ncbi:MAG: PEP-CTERM sorting domain-containing protein [Armatimonadetes bacterium]|nr:PEP-CTERM sorting domain-containing protein [Armatimonadota bacterium]MBX3109052.1 PEP-CTERM sorting domain-containing protein [Fimbriimonadaceae bacterium]
MKKSMLVTAIAVVAATSHAATVALWDFNDSNTVPEIGTGSIALLGGVTNPGYNSGVGSSDPAASGNLGFQTTTYAAQGTESGLRGVQFNASTVGFTNIRFQFDIRKSNTSSRFVEVFYTLDGTNFTTLGTLDQNQGDTWFNNNFFDVSGVAGSANNANFGFKVVTVFDPNIVTAGQYSASNPASTYAATGTLRYDMVTVLGDAVPEPATMTLLAGIALAAIARRRKN